MVWRKVQHFQFYGFLSLCPLVSSAARSDELAAIVEDLSPGVNDIGLFEYLSPGAEVNLAAEDWLKLGYLHSCIQETITDGAVLVGQEQSTVTGGTVERRTVECDGGNLQLTSDQSERAGVAVMRKSEGGIDVALTVHGLSPYFRIDGAPKTLDLERLDRPQQAVKFNVGANGVDLAELGVALKKGGLYRARVAGREIIFRVDKYARPGVVPLLSRLVPL